MTSVDTSVLVRFLTKDDAKQFETAATLIRENLVFVPDTVMLETEWVLRYAYEFGSGEITSAFRRLLGLENVVFNDATTLELAIEWNEKGVDFADALHLASSQHVSTFATFDKALCKHAIGLGSCDLKQLR